MASNFESSIHKGGDFIHEFACSPCDEDGLNTEAQHFCSQCTKYYCNTCVTKHNGLYKRHSVLGRKDVKKWVAAQGTVDALERCERHPGIALELVCVDHDQLCCHVCVAVNHRPCSSILHITDVAKGISKDPEFHQLQQKVADLRKQLECMKNARKKNGVSLRKTRVALVDEVKIIRKKINDMLDRMEKTTVTELDGLIAKHEMSIKKDIDFCTQMHEDLESLMDGCDNKLSSGETVLYVGFKKCGEKMKEAREHLQRMSTVESYNITYQPDKAIEKMFSLQHFGVSTDSVPFAAQFQPEHVFQALGYKEYNVKMSSDKVNCDILGVCELPDGGVVITDWNNCKVKLLDQKYRVVDHCDVPEHPYDVCHIGGNEVAVCVNKRDLRRELHFINRTKGKLVTTRKLRFTHNCYIVAQYGNNLYISSDTALYVYTMTGKQIKKLFEDKSGDEKLANIAISNDGKIIYITNYSNNQLITLDNLGNKLATFTDPELRGPNAVQVTPAGHILVCCSDSNTVLQVDNDRKKERKVTTLAWEECGVYLPRSLLFSSRTSSMIVGGKTDLLLIIKLQ
ncbi:uncharacterized protein LOC128217701 [Mya arenaria]|uniref:uncharacterized protein LOC128217701 n=1 Tax=Mya arenaria TaxID=6604 RepID=UPI0022E1D355|nr:uncharacterized protein LOC128217701 [Mya arenaria]